MELMDELIANTGVAESGELAQREASDLAGGV